MMRNIAFLLMFVVYRFPLKNEDKIECGSSSSIFLADEALYNVQLRNQQPVGSGTYGTGIVPHNTLFEIQLMSLKGCDNSLMSRTWF
jgi:hypothetical protein